MAVEAMEDPVVARPLPVPRQGRTWRLWILGGAALAFALIATAEWRRALAAEAVARAGAVKSAAPAVAMDTERSYQELLAAPDLRIALLVQPAPEPVPAPRRGRKAPRRPLAAPAPFPGKAQVLWDPARRSGLLRASGLPPAPQGQEYAFWIKVEGPVDAYEAAGPIALSNEGVLLKRFQGGAESERHRAAGFALSLERADGTVAPAVAGSPGHPRGRIVLRSGGPL
jgi:hypothetical protein